MQCRFSYDSAIRETSAEKLHQGLGLEFLENRSMLQRLCQFYKI